MIKMENSIRSYVSENNELSGNNAQWVVENIVEGLLITVAEADINGSLIEMNSSITDFTATLTFIDRV